MPMAETTLYRQLTLEQVTDAITRSLEDKRFTDQEQLLQIILADARLLALSIQEGIDQEAANDTQAEKDRIASALQFLASRAGESDIFSSYGIVSLKRT